MSEEQALQPMKRVMAAIYAQRERFLKLDSANGRLLDFQQECLFAHQQIMKSDFTAKVAAENLPSLKSAIMNVAAIGISLNPATQHAYLVPRDGRICLDISYRGLVKLATDAQAITWAKAELVFEKDTFAYRGPSTPPGHTADVFGERGDFKGGYVIAKLPDGDVLIETMSVAEIHKVRNTSKAYKKGGGPWIDWENEMYKKTLIKRAYKSWPQTPGRVRLDKAVEALNEHEGIAYTLEQQTEYFSLLRNGDALGFFLFCRGLDETTHSALFSSFDAGAKTADKQRARDLVARGGEEFRETGHQLIECSQRGDEAGMVELLAALSEPARRAILESVPGDVSAMATDALQGAAA